MAWSSSWFLGIIVFISIVGVVVLLSREGQDDKASMAWMRKTIAKAQDIKKNASSDAATFRSDQEQVVRDATTLACNRTQWRNNFAASLVTACVVSVTYPGLSSKQRVGIYFLTLSSMLASTQFSSMNHWAHATRPSLLFLQNCVFELLGYESRVELWYDDPMKMLEVAKDNGDYQENGKGASE